MENITLTELTFDEQEALQGGNYPTYGSPVNNVQSGASSSASASQGQAQGQQGQQQGLLSKLGL